MAWRPATLRGVWAVEVSPGKWIELARGTTGEVRDATPLERESKQGTPLPADHSLMFCARGYVVGPFAPQDFVTDPTPHTDPEIPR